MASDEQRLCYGDMPELSDPLAQVISVDRREWDRGQRAIAELARLRARIAAMLEEVET